MLSELTEQNLEQVAEMMFHAPVAILLLKGPSHTVEMANKLALSLWRKSEESFLHKPLLQSLPELTEQGFDKILDKVYRDGQGTTFKETPLRINNGVGIDTIYTKLSLEPYRNREGAVEGLYCVACDVTEDALSKARIQDSAFQFMNLANAMPQIVWIARATGDVVYYNDRISHYAGARKQADGVWSWEGILHPDDVELTTNAWKHAVKNGTVYEAEHRLRMNTGEYRWHLSRALPQKDELGNVTQWYGTATDFHLQKEVESYKDGPDRQFVGGVGYEVTRQRKVEETLQKFAAHLQLATEAANVGTWVFDLGTQKLEWSRLHKRLWGYEENQEELNYEDWHKVIFEEDKPQALERVQETIDRNEPYDVFYRIRRHGDGATKWMRSLGKCLYNEMGVPVTMTGVTIDVTEEKVREREFLKVKEQLELTFRNVPTGILLFNKEKRLVFANDKGAKFSGFKSVEEMLADTKLNDLREKSLKRFTVRDEAGKTMTADRSGVVQAFVTKQTIQGVYSIQYMEDNSVIWIYYVCNPLLDEKGEVNMVIATITDITLQKEAEILVRDSEEKLRILAASIPELVIMTDPDGNVEYSSDRWQEYAGVDLANTSWTSLLHDDDGNILEEWPQWIRNRMPFKAELRLQNREHEFRWHAMRAEPVRDEDGGIIKWICVFTDINEQKSSAEMLEKLVAQRTFELQRSNEGLQQFAHVASHDLKEPVRKIKIFGNRLREEFGDSMPGEARVYLGKMETAANRMLAMIEGVLQYSSLNATQQEIKKVDLNDVIKSIESDLEIVVSEKKAVIDYDPLPVIEGAPVLLYQLFYNLINNSLKFSKGNVAPEIKIRSSMIRSSGLKYVKLEVIDNGIGFEQGYADKIFYTFARLNPKDLFEGTGLGLALCKTIVERHQGFITAEGQLNQGATFTVILPVSPTSAGEDMAFY